jgi:hypothetical protein
MEPLRWTLHMDDYVRFLTETKETELDLLLCIQTKCLLIMNQVTGCPTEQVAVGESSNALPAYFVKAMDVQLQNMRRNLPSEMQTNSGYQSSYIVTSHRLTEQDPHYYAYLVQKSL